MIENELLYLNEDVVGFQPPSPTLSWRPELDELIDDRNTGMFTSHGPGGELHSRPMLTFAIDKEGSVWFLTSLRSEKTHDLDTDPNVSVSYFVNNENKFISLSGVATLVEDRERIQAWWRPQFFEWFPDGWADPALRMIRVQITRAEAWGLNTEQ